MKKFLVGLLFLIACSTLLISEDLNSSVGVQKEDIFLRLDTGGHTALIKDIIVTKSGDIISASDDKTIRVWDSKTGREKRKILGQIGAGVKGIIYAMALSPNEEFLAIGGFLANPKNRSKASAIRIYNYQSGKLLKVLKSHNDVVEDLAFSNDGKYLISGSQDNTAKIWRVEDFTLLDTIEFHTNFVGAVKIIKKEGNYFAITAGFDNRIALYDMQMKEIVKSHKLGYKLMFLATSKENIAVCGFNGNKIQIYNFNLNPTQIIISKTEPKGLAYSPNGKLLITGFSFDYQKPTDIINIYSVNQNYKKIQSFKKYTNATIAVAFLDNQTAISGGGDRNEIYIWNIKTAQVLKKIDGVGNTVWSVGVKGDRVAWGNKFLTQYTMKHHKGKLQKSINLKNFQISGQGLNSLFHRISTTYKNYQLSHRRGGDYGYTDAILDIKKDGKTIASITRDSTNGYRHNCYGFYKNYIVSGGMNGFLKIYNLDGKEIANLVGHTGEIYSIALDDNRLISGSLDETIKIWNLKDIDSFDEAKIIFILKNSLADKSGLKINDIIYAINDKKFKNTNEFQSLLKELGEYKITLKRKNKKIDLFLKKDVKTIGFISNLHKTIYPQLSLFITKTNEWIAWTPEGYFNASEKGANYLYFHLNHGAEHEAEAIPMKKLYDHFFRPDLIKLKLTGEEEAYQKAIGKLDFREALKNPPPTVKIDKIKKETSKDKIKLAFNIEEQKGGVGLIRIYQEGKLIVTIGEGEVKRQSANIDAILAQDRRDAIQRKAQEKKRKVNDKNISKDIKEVKFSVPKVTTPTTTNKAGAYSVEIDLKSGNNEIAIEAFNKTNTVASYRESVTIDAKIPKRKPKLYVIVAGVNEFESTAEGIKNLRYSENDANAIKDSVEQKMETVFSDINMTTLIGKELTKANLYKKVKAISEKAHLEDTVLFYISTHGRSEGEELYLVPYNNGDAEDWLKFKDTFQAIQSIKALNQIFVIDACESGTANDIVSAVYDSKASVLAKSSGVHMLLATTRGTNAFESDDPKVKNGVFTHRILEALRSRGTDLNKDNFISIKEVSTELRKPQSNSEFQYPVIRNVGSDVRLERVE